MSEEMEFKTKELNEIFELVKTLDEKKGVSIEKDEGIVLLLINKKSLMELMSTNITMIQTLRLFKCNNNISILLKNKIKTFLDGDKNVEM